MYLNRRGSMIYRTKPMKKTLFAAVAACVISAAVPAVAFAGDLNRESTRLPDGSTLIVITTKQGGLAAPSSATVTRFLCPVQGPCVLLGSEAYSQEGILAGLPGDVVRAVGLREFGRSLRPSTSETYVSSYSDSSSASGANANAQQSQCSDALLCVNDSTNNSSVDTNGGDSYDFDEDDDGKG